MRAPLIIEVSTPKTEAGLLVFPIIRAAGATALDPEGKRNCLPEEHLHNSLRYLCPYCYFREASHLLGRDPENHVRCYRRRYSESLGYKCSVPAGTYDLRCQLEQLDDGHTGSPYHAAGG